MTIARGDERSRNIDEIVSEINFLHSSGVQEIVITGVHVGGYGSDIGSSLYALINEILARTEVPRVRLASVEPWDLEDNFFELFRNPRLMPHMHLPIQSGCDSVLRRMSRRCKTTEFLEIVEKAREAVPLFNITTDLIAGFPGETEREWQQTMDFIERVGFGHMHIFTFSPRAGTKAATLAGQLDNATKKARSRQMHELAVRLKEQELKKHLGGTVPVLWEQKLSSTDDYWLGYTPHYHRVMSNNKSIHESDIMSVRLDQLGGDGLVLVNQAVNHSVTVNFS